MNDSATWLVAYDIRSPRRLRQVHRYLSERAIHIQYSVFLAEGNAQRIGVIRKGLDDIIDRKEDDVRIYRVPESPSIHTLGIQGLPSGALLIGKQPSALTTQKSSAIVDKSEIDLEDV